MQHDHVQRLHYTTHALTQLRQDNELLHASAPSMAVAYRAVCVLLERSVKFLLPNCANLIEIAEFRQAHVDGLKLPFPVVAIEAPWMKEEGLLRDGVFAQSPASKRIALCWEARADEELFPGTSPIAQRFPGGGVFVIPVFWMDHLALWQIGTVGEFVPSGSQLTPLSDPARPVDQYLWRALASGTLLPKQPQGVNLRSFVVLPENFHAAAHRLGEAQAVAALDVRDELFMRMQLCAVLQCHNVRTADLPPPQELNRKRVAKGNVPFFTYKVLQVPGERNTHERNGGGHHASSRLHLRRGHIRRLDQKTVWVRPTLVNRTASHGLVM
jgi:hypothetical protein